QEIIISGKNKTIVTDSLAKAIKIENALTNSIFIFLKQSLRDAIYDKNYNIIIASKLWNQMQSDLSVLTTLKALQGVHHKILEDKDTIGSFSI
ncbi:hypothetical protein ABTK28_20360, partial [Acinetobacter baumannii]